MFKRAVRYLLIAQLAVLVGCTKESLEDCIAGLKLKFIFTLHTNEGDNRFGPDVQKVKVYFFDENKVLAHVQEEQGAALTNDYAMDVQIAPGKYTVVAWAGSNEDLGVSYHEGQMINAQESVYENGVTIGRTTLDDFRIFINYNIADELPEDVVPIVDELDDLYYGAAGIRESGTSKYIFKQVEVKLGVANVEQIELIRNTNILKVTIAGLQYLQQASPKASGGTRAAGISGSNILEVWASARNGRYKFDNSIGEYARMVRYAPIYRSVDANTMVVDVKTMRLDMARHTAEPVYLTVRNPVTGTTFPKKPIDVVNSLLQAKDPSTGNYIYQTQEDFDKIYEYPLDIVITSDLHIKIFVQGWEIILLYPEV